jgi:hypothetical protein
MTGGTSLPLRLSERLFYNSKFTAVWMGFLLVVFQLVSWPARNIALVFWVYGKNAYVSGGIRVLPGKPVRFSNGVKVPTLPDMITGFGAFSLTFFGLTLLLICVLRLYERRRSKKERRRQ